MRRCSFTNTQFRGPFCVLLRFVLLLNNRTAELFRGQFSQILPLDLIFLRVTGRTGMEVSGTHARKGGLQVHKVGQHAWIEPDGVTDPDARNLRLSCLPLNCGLGHRKQIGNI